MVLFMFLRPGKVLHHVLDKLFLYLKKSRITVFDNSTRSLVSLPLIVCSLFSLSGRLLCSRSCYNYNQIK